MTMMHSFQNLDNLCHSPNVILTHAVLRANRPHDVSDDDALNLWYKSLMFGRVVLGQDMVGTILD